MKEGKELAFCLSSSVIPQATSPFDWQHRSWLGLTDRRPAPARYELGTDRIASKRLRSISCHTTGMFGRHTRESQQFCMTGILSRDCLLRKGMATVRPFCKAARRAGSSAH
jgi:hypothetical protein